MAISRKGPPISPSRALARTESDSMRTPDLSFGATMSIIACMIDGTPAMAVQGRYTVSAEQGGSREGMLDTVSYLVDLSRKSGK